MLERQWFRQLGSFPRCHSPWKYLRYDFNGCIYEIFWLVSFYSPHEYGALAVSAVAIMSNILVCPIHPTRRKSVLTPQPLQACRLCASLAVGQFRILMTCLSPPQHNPNKRIRFERTKLIRTAFKSQKRGWMLFSLSSYLYDSRVERLGIWVREHRFDSSSVSCRTSDNMVCTFNLVVFWVDKYDLLFYNSRSPTMVSPQKVSRSVLAKVDIQIRGWQQPRWRSELLSTHSEAEQENDFFWV